MITLGQVEHYWQGGSSAARVGENFRSHWRSTLLFSEKFSQTKIIFTEKLLEEKSLDVYLFHSLLQHLNIFHVEQKNAPLNGAHHLEVHDSPSL